MKSNNNIKIFPPEGYEIDKASIVDNTAVVTFKKVNKKLPKTWEEFCGTFPLKDSEVYIDNSSKIFYSKVVRSRNSRYCYADRNILPDYTTAEAVLALCQLIQLRNCYNGDWVPDWFKGTETKYVINFVTKDIVVGERTTFDEVLYFKTKELHDEFLRNFRPLIEKLKPLYGIKEGDEK